MSTDADKRWTTLPTTKKANTALSGLAIGVTAALRFRATSSNTTSDWNQTVSLLVH